MTTNYSNYLCTHTMLNAKQEVEFQRDTYYLGRVVVSAFNRCYMQVFNEQHNIVEVPYPLAPLTFSQVV